MLTSCGLEHQVRSHIQDLRAEAERERRLAPARPTGVLAAVWAAVYGYAVYAG